MMSEPQILVYILGSSVMSNILIEFQTKQELRDSTRSPLYALHQAHLRHKCLKPVSADLAQEQAVVIKFQQRLAMSVNKPGEQLLDEVGIVVSVTVNRFVVCTRESACDPPAYAFIRSARDRGVRVRGRRDSRLCFSICANHATHARDLHVSAAMMHSIRYNEINRTQVLYGQRKAHDV